MKRLLVLSVLLFTVLFPYTVVAQENGSVRKSFEYSFPEKIQSPSGLPLAAGTYSIGTGGYFPTIDSAFRKLSLDGIAGEIVLELIDELYIAPTTQYGFLLNGPIPGSSSKVTIKPAANKNVILEGNGGSIFTFNNTNYVTVDGVSLTGITTLTFHTFQNTAFTWNDGIDFLNNSDHNVIQNIIFINEDIARYGGSSFWTSSGYSTAPDSNVIQDNFVKQAGMAFYISAYNAPVRAMGNIIRRNKIGSETDSLIAWGIQLERCQNTIVENNIIQNIKVTNNGDQVNPGINSYCGSGDIIRNNTVHNINPTKGYSSVGILLSGGAGLIGSNNQVYNNMIYDINSTSTSYDSRVTGIQIWYQNDPKIYYNSIYLTGTGSNKYGSAALYIYMGSANVDVRNNILVNTRDESPYCASAIRVYSGYSTFATDYNNLFYEPNQNNCLVRIGSIDYHTLADWQAVGKDLHSINEMPNFIEPDNLHINTLIATHIESGGTPITGIEADFDGDLRNTSKPDIGADEMNGIVLPVELTSFTAEALDQIVILKWTTATELNNNGFEVQRKVAESDFATIGFARGEGTTTTQKEYSYIDKDLVDGKYLYRLKQVDYNGTYEYSDVIEVDVRSLDDYALEQNFPNPFNPTTTIGYVLIEKTNAKLILLNAIGEEVAVLVNEEQDKGYHKVDVDAANLPSGVYFYQLKAGDYTSVKKMLLIK